MTMPRIDAWLRGSPPDADARARLFCLPYAGGGASTYRGWQVALGPEIHVVAVQPPGREDRMLEEPYRSLPSLRDAVVDAMTPLLDLPAAIFGHSMGALVGYEVARSLQRRCSLAHLFVSGHSAPHLAPSRPPIHDLPDHEFISALRSLDGTPEQALAHPELMELLLPGLRSDFLMGETYAHRDGPRLDCPVTAFGGTADSLVPVASLSGWGEVTSGGFSVRMVPGDHFFVRRARPYLVEIVAERLLAACERP